MDLTNLNNEYDFDCSIFSDVDNRLLSLKPKIDMLSESDKIIFYLYAELGSYRKVGRVLGFSHNTAGNLIREIKKKILC